MRTERKREGGTGADVCLALGSLLLIRVSSLLARRKEGVSKAFSSEQTHRRLPKLTAISCPLCQDAAGKVG